ncbi:non-ribosomal peptide synthetase [Streptomyces sp. NBC_01381]|uniref:non-ribosomal peptide synthetase n=1 Tax=Streptomyces sp. NBC_01381 TaxID=2903845 RepID=UPI0022545B65|nr:non-ribosomal peptide synthetase [Streptomyces sp. NBC_01381]MCX4670630.1 non-ribosomal peptide synthetase [Streptomyces sp. NBC_01381]
MQCDTVLTNFRRQAARTPDATALIVGATELTYRQLDHASAGLARLLWENGARQGRVVCIRVEQGDLAVIAVLAALRVGAAWCALEPDLPAARVRQLCRDTDCAVLLSAAPEQGGADPGGPAAPSRWIDAAGLDVPALIAAGSQERDDPYPPVPDSAPAYLVYTSGSTGTPKGVVVSRAQLAASTAPRADVYGTEPSTYLMAMRLSFDGMLGGMFWSFRGGHTLLLPDTRQLRHARELALLAGEHRATHLIVVPSYYRALLDHSTLLADTLRLVVVAGEVCTPELVRTHRRLLPGVRLANEYGPTETTISCTVEPDPDPDQERVPIGRPWPGATTYVLDERLREVPAGTVGELYVGGTFVAIGYAGQPARTAERFVADPFGLPGTRLYRTGDRALVDDRGALHYYGRTDFQVKVRGLRVELGEIESVLETHPAVGQAVVLYETDQAGSDQAGSDQAGSDHAGSDQAEGEGGGSRLVAFWTPAAPGAASPSSPSSAELRQYCLDHLVEQAVPAQFVPLTAMPLNTSSKADRAALSTLARARAGTAPRHTRWSGPQRVVGEIWAAVLRHSDIGPDDNFFAVGGSSLKIIDLHARLNEQWPGVLRVGELFDLITISAQADAIVSRTGTGTGTGEGPAPGIPARTPDAPAAYEL